MTTYMLLTAALTPAEKGAHEIVRVEHELLAKPLIVAARFSPDRLKWADAKKWAAGLTLGGFSWRLPTVEEAFFIPDRSKYPAYDTEVFVGDQSAYPWIWTSTPHAEAASVCGWVVDLRSYSGKSYPDDKGLVLAVRVSGMLA